MPIGFEPMGMYYNRGLLQKVPTLWATLPEILKPEPSEEINVPDPEENTLLTVSSTK